MYRYTKLARAIVAVLSPGIALAAGDAVAQEKSLKEQLVGAWTLVSNYVERQDGTKIDRPNLKGVVIYSSDGKFALVNVSSDLPRLAANDRARATPEEAKAVVAGSIAYFGSYSVDEANKVITVNIEGSTFANQVGGTDNKRVITLLTATELRFTNPASQSGTKIHLVWKRAN